jgi:membrane-bound serine protease (ClpP class)
MKIRRFSTIILFSMLLSALAIAAIATTTGASQGAGSVYVIKIKDHSINPVTADYIAKSIDKAHRNNIDCLVIELDTPGGLITSTRSIVKSILSSKVPVCVYIYPSGSRAGSAGVFITYSSHVAAMAPSTNIGAAHPVSMGGQGRSIWDALRDLLDQAGKEEADEDKAPGR